MSNTPQLLFAMQLIRFNYIRHVWIVRFCQSSEAWNDRETIYAYLINLIVMLSIFLSHILSSQIFCKKKSIIFWLQKIYLHKIDPWNDCQHTKIIKGLQKHRLRKNTVHGQKELQMSISEKKQFFTDLLTLRGPFETDPKSGAPVIFHN